MWVCVSLCECLCESFITTLKQSKLWQARNMEEHLRWPMPSKRRVFFHFDDTDVYRRANGLDVEPRHLKRASWRDLCPGIHGVKGRVVASAHFRTETQGVRGSMKSPTSHWWPRTRDCQRNSVDLLCCQQPPASVGFMRNHHHVGGRSRDLV